MTEAYDRGGVPPAKNGQVLQLCLRRTTQCADLRFLRPAGPPHPAILPCCWDEVGLVKRIFERSSKSDEPAESSVVQEIGEDVCEEGADDPELFDAHRGPDGVHTASSSGPRARSRAIAPLDVVIL